MLGLLDLPAEIRLTVYHFLFGIGKAVIDNGSQNEKPCLISHQGTIHAAECRSAQILRICKLVNLEARPLLYAATQFVSLSEAFAGRLPSTFHSGNTFAHLIRHLAWQLHCDFMKHLYIGDVQISPEEMSNIQTLELRCQAETWRGSFCGAWTDEQAIVRGRQDMLRYARQVRHLMRVTCTDPVFVVEDTTQHHRGRLILRIQRSTPLLGERVIVED